MRIIPYLYLSKEYKGYNFFMNINNFNLERLSQSKVTSGLMLINIVVFVLMSLTGGSENIENLIRFGANAKPLVADGQWWRLFTASFIHIGFFHIMFNMYFLYNLGPVFERLYGHGAFLLIYLISGIFGNLLSFAFGSAYSVSAGASTSLYGMLGLAIGMMFVYKDDEIIRSFGSSFISVVVINVIYSFLSPRVGILGHAGGFIAGFALAAIFPILNREIPKNTQMIAAVGLVVLALILIKIGKGFSFGG